MGTISLVIPQIGQPDTTEDVKVQNAFTTIQTVINGNIDTNNISPTAGITAAQLAAAAAQSATVNQAGQTVKGSSIIATSEARTNVAFGTLTTPDQVTGIVLPAAGVITVLYQATWQESVANAAQAQIFLNSNPVQLTGNNGSVAFGTAFVASAGGTARNTPLSSWAGGLSSPPAQATGSAADATTGQFIGNWDQVSAARAGGPAYIFASAGTYTVSVQFKATSGTVTVASRRLYVQAVSYA